MQAIKFLVGNLLSKTGNTQIGPLVGYYLDGRLGLGLLAIVSYGLNFSLPRWFYTLIWLYCFFRCRFTNPVRMILTVSAKP